MNLIKEHLLDINKGTNDNMDNPWNEGYLSALADEKRITEDQHDKLMNWLKG